MKHRLTPKEYEITKLLSDDITYKKIGEKAGIHWTLVRNYIIKSRKKTGALTDRMLINKFKAGEIYT